jgi:uncharacterized protein involved in type VI secretion and phage assembly
MIPANLARIEFALYDTPYPVIALYGKERPNQTTPLAPGPCALEETSAELIQRRMAHEGIFFYMAPVALQPQSP